jgi:hypothetical protein
MPKNEQFVTGYEREHFDQDVQAALDLVIEERNHEKYALSTNSFDMVQEFKRLTNLDHSTALRILGTELRRRTGANSV